MQKTSQMVYLIALLMLMTASYMVESVTVQGMHDNGLLHTNMSARNSPTDCAPGFYPCGGGCCFDDGLCCGSLCCRAPGSDPPTCCGFYCCYPGFSCCGTNRCCADNAVCCGNICCSLHAGCCGDTCCTPTVTTPIPPPTTTTPAGRGFRLGAGLLVLLWCLFLLSLW